MAHNINFNKRTNEHSFFSVLEKPWHGLGKVVADYPNSSDAIKFAGLDYDVEKRPLYTHSSEGIPTEEQKTQFPALRIPGYFATVRKDTESILGVVGKDYGIVQNRDAFSFFDSIVGGEGILYETAGALGKGERIFITAKLPGYIRVGHTDLIEKYLFLTTSHDGYGCITAAFTPVRIVCNNTLHAALKNCSNSIKIRHTVNAQERLKHAHSLMGISNQLSAELENIFNRWAGIAIKDSEVKKLIEMALMPGKEVFDTTNNAEKEINSAYFKNSCGDAFTYAMTSPTQQTQTTKGTVFGAYNAITGYLQNIKTYKNEEVKLKSILLEGTSQLRSRKAFNLCSAFVKSGGNIININ